MRHHLLSLLAGAASLAAPVALCAAQTGSPPAGTPPAAAARATDTIPAKGLPVDGIAAVVGDQVILISEVVAAANQHPSRPQVRTEAELLSLQKQTLQELVEAELLVQRAKVEKIETSDVELLQQMDAREKEIRGQFKSDAEFRAALRENGFGTIEEWRRLQTDQMRRITMQREVMQKLKRDGKVTNVNVSEAEITEAYEAAKAQLPRKPARIGIRQIVLPTLPSEASKKRARAKADSIRAELEKHPDDFENVAKKESMDPASRELGGDLGWNRRGRFVPEFDRMVFALNPGVISPVFETSFGYHILRVDRVQPAEVKSRHILIKFTLDSADDARARAVAVEVAEAWRKGANVDSLTIRHHDEASGEQKTIPEFARDSLPEAYRNAVEGKKVGDVVDPFAVPDGSGANKYVVAQITMLDEAGEYTLAEYRDRLRAHLSEERSMRRLIDSLKEQTYVSVRFDPTKQGATP